VGTIEIGFISMVLTPSSQVRERESERERERERERGREREREKEREGCRICPELLFLFLK
jgi:hypothetical protein